MKVYSRDLSGGTNLWVEDITSTHLTFRTNEGGRDTITVSREAILALYSLLEEIVRDNSSTKEHKIV